MSVERRITILDQTCEWLKQRTETGEWNARVPRVRDLATDFGVAPNTMLSALKRLDAEGYFKTEGRIRIPANPTKAGKVRRDGLRIGFLMTDAPGTSVEGLQHLVLQLRLKLESHGYKVLCWQRDPDVFEEQRAAALLREMETAGFDAWVIVAGSAPLLTLAAKSAVPMLALAGRSIGLPIASSGMSVVEPLRQLVRELAELGHRRIVLVCSRLARMPVPGRLVVAFREELKALQLDAGEFNLPDWEPTPEGLRALFDSLFRLTPPTAVILWNDELAVGLLHYAASAGLKIPQDLTVVSLEGPGALRWCHPPVAHFRMDGDRQVAAVLQWVEGVRHGRVDRDSRPVPGILERGGSIGVPTPKRAGQSRV